MDAKLTLKLDNMVINSAKEYAKNNRKSLSKLVEDFFKNLTYENKQIQEYPPLIKRLSGVVSENDLKKLSAKDEKARYILKKNN